MARAAQRHIFDTLDLCDRAAVLLKDAGFVHYQTSMKTEACYYRWPDRPHLLRLASHSGGKTRNGLGPVAAKLTFTGNVHSRPGTMRLAHEKFEQMVALAVGQYFIKSARQP